MDRRRFLELLASAALAPPGSYAAGDVGLRLSLHPDKPGNFIPDHFTGLSYETSQLHDPSFFSPANQALAGYVRRLGSSGVLRVGGNSSEWSDWRSEGAPALSEEDSEFLAANVLSEALRPDLGKGPAARRTVTPLAVRNLRDFLDLTGWLLIYGLNLGTATPEVTAAEAAYVQNIMGDRLIAFQLGNEPDLFYRNGIRNRDYDFAKFAAEWQHYFDVIRHRVPKAAFAGPDTAYNTDWLVPFANRFKHDVRFLSQHYYAEGPPTDPSMTIERLLTTDPNLMTEFAGMAQTKHETGLPFRMTETNSCYRGGKQFVSNTLGSALWGADLMYQLADAGGNGINFHGGGYGWYTPIAGTPQKGFVARPLYYGMLLFAEAGPGRLVECVIDEPADAGLFTAYGFKSPSGVLKSVVFNKNEDRDLTIAIDTGTLAGSAKILRLCAPRIDSTSDTTLGGAPVGEAGAWSPKVAENATKKYGAVTIHVPRASAALVTFGAP
jgi:Glycosyl hydrolase family 79 C-terminal beta domain